MGSRNTTTAVADNRRKAQKKEKKEGMLVWICNEKEES